MDVLGSGAGGSSGFSFILGASGPGPLKRGSISCLLKYNRASEITMLTTERTCVSEKDEDGFSSLGAVVSSGCAAFSLALFLLSSASLLPAATLPGSFLVLFSCLSM